MIESHIPTMEKASDVKATLFLVSVAGGVLWLSAFLHGIVTDPHRAYLLGLLSTAKLEMGELASISVIAALVAFVTIVIFEVHKTVYDRHFVKWRARHNSEFVLPRLFGVIRDQLTPDYLLFLKANTEKLCDRVFCPFVDGKTPRLSSNLIRRFYRALTWYWMAELAEMALIAFLVCTFAYAAWGRFMGTISLDWQASLLFKLPIVLTLGAITNLIAVRAARAAVRDRSLAEINEIIELHRDELQKLVLREAKDGQFLSTNPVMTATTFDGYTDQVFLASPMASYADEVEYGAERELMLALVSCLENHCGFTEVHYAGKKLAAKGEFHDYYRALTDDLRDIQRSGVFIFHYPKPLPTSALFALGYALALGKQVVMLVKEHDDLPYLLKAAGQLDRVTECKYRDESDLVGLIVATHQTLFQPKRSGAPAVPAAMV